jgi:hypothetical protein
MDRRSAVQLGKPLGLCDHLHHIASGGECRTCLYAVQAVSGAAAESVQASLPLWQPSAHALRVRLRTPTTVRRSRSARRTPLTCYPPRLISVRPRRLTCRRSCRCRPPRDLPRCTTGRQRIACGSPGISAMRGQWSTARRQPWLVVSPYRSTTTGHVRARSSTRPSMRRASLPGCAKR